MKENKQLSFHVEEASLHVLVAFDIGFEIRLPLIPSLFADRPQDKSGYGFLYSPIGREGRPVRIAFEPEEIKVQGKAKKCQIFATFFDVGAISLEMIFPLQAEFEEMPRIAFEVQNSIELKEKAQALAERIAQQARAAVINYDFFPRPSTFAVFNIRRLAEPVQVQSILDHLGVFVAKTLRVSDEPIGASEVTRTLNPNVTYSDADVVFTSANVAMVFDETSNEVIDLFELVNVQALELRFIDARLDRTLLSLYEENEQHGRWRGRFPNLLERQARRLNTTHLDSTIIVERVEQGFKFAQDSHMVRIHELCVRNMFLQNLSRGIDRKLQAVRDIFNDQMNRAHSMRMEILEWIIVALIAIEAIPALVAALH
jgi:hypothetical protein